MARILAFLKVESEEVRGSAQRAGGGEAEPDRGSMLCLPVVRCFMKAQLRACPSPPGRGRRRRKYLRGFLRQLYYDFIDSIISFDNKNEQCNEILFALKVKLFENDIVKNSADKDTKSLLRSAKTPVEAIKLFDKLNG